MEAKLKLIQLALKMKIQLLKIGTWLWTETETTPEQEAFLKSHGFQFSKGKSLKYNRNVFFLKGSDAVKEWGHYEPQPLEKIMKVYPTKKVYPQNYKKLVTAL